jgi:putative phosphoribosyl transferase
MRFIDREEAGIVLGHALQAHRAPDALVLALPEGVAVGYHVARLLDAPLEVIVARQVAVPDRPDLPGLGAVAEGGVRQVELGMARTLGVAPEALRRAVRAAEREVERRVMLYRGGRPLPDVRGRTVILVDDGIVRGVTARAAIAALRERGVGKLVLAAPVGASSTTEALGQLVSAVVCLVTPATLASISDWYEELGQATDAEVASWLARARQEAAGKAACAQRLDPATSIRERAPGRMA